jgi:dTDP-3-amino-2,3,6-trideoxy-4-keto-D-glucose/dTDP-3-amino-3,4,6-trideoxy-alpha-D-glucose/dTDP-2,6-dideoxy-D-kanosamine transaminase
MDASLRSLLSADPKAGYLAHASGIAAAIDRVLQSGYYILGPEVEAFETEFAAYQGSGFAIGVANGTEALELALRAAGVRPGDVVATVANTVTATVTAIVEIGATPRFIDIDPNTMTMSPAALAQALGRERVAAVIPVHLYGQPAMIEEIVDIARGHGVVVVEDCAQAHGARIGNRRVGTWGAFAAFSFYPTKNLGALGDGGAVTTSDAEGAARVRALRQYGWKQRYIAEGSGRNSRLDELQAAILRVKLPHLDTENAQRRLHAARFRAALHRTALRPPPDAPGAVYHQYVVRHPARESLRQHLAAQRILAGVLYPVPVHRQPAFSQPDLHLPHTEAACAEVLSLPVHPGLTPEDLERIVQAVQSWQVP